MSIQQYANQNVRAMETLRELIRRRRTDRGLTQVELSRRAGIAQGVVSRIETGAYKEVPPVDVMEGLARELGLSQAVMLESLGYDLDIHAAIDTDPIRAQLISKLERVRLSIDRRSETLDGLLDNWLRFDREAEEGIDHAATTRHKGGVRRP